MKNSTSLREEFEEAFRLAFQQNHSIQYYGGLVEKWAADWWMARTILRSEVERKYEEMKLRKGKDIANFKWL